MFGLYIGAANYDSDNVIDANILFYNVDSLKQLYTGILESIESDTDYAWYKTIACNVNAHPYDGDHHLHNMDIYIDEDHANCVAFEFIFSKPNDYDRYTVYIDVDTLDAVIQIESTIEDYTVEVYVYPMQLGTSTSIRDLINKQMSQVAFPSNELRGPFVDDGEEEDDVGEDR